MHHALRPRPHLRRDLLTLAAGAVVLLRGTTRLEDLALGSALLVGGTFSSTAMLLALANVPPERTVDFGLAGTWVFLLGNATIAVAGALLCRSAAGRRAAPAPQPAHAAPPLGGRHIL